jgi:hypothetical protein
MESLFEYLRFATKFWGVVLLFGGATFGSVIATAVFVGDPWDIVAAVFWLVVLLPYAFATGHAR